MIRPTVLVVDDDADVRASVVLALSFEGYLVSEAENGRVALDRLRAGHRPDVILLDLVMPELDGAGFRAAQRGDPALAAIPVVIFTASGAPPEAVSHLGAQGQVAKPVGLDELIDELGRVRFLA